MALTLDLASATLTADPQGSNADIHLGTRRFLMHGNIATANKKAADSITITKGTTGGAIKFTGTVFLASSANEFDISPFEFGMVQVSNLLDFIFVYAGSTPQQGSVRQHLRLGFTTNPSLDVEPLPGESIDDHIFNPTNLIANRVTTPKPGFEIEVNFSDHPFGLVPYRFENRVTRATNLIARASRNEDFTTFFVARASPTSPLICLARGGFHVIWRAEFKWRTGVAKPDLEFKSRLFSASAIQTGAPPPGDSHFQIASARSLPSSNTQDQAAFSAVERRSRPVCDELREWPDQMPPDFFK
jgi:hypothetical protein